MNTRDTYNQIAEDWVKEHDQNTWGKKGADMFMSFLPIGSTVLDLGCGGGIRTNYIAMNGYNASGIDLSEKMIEIARRNYPHLQFVVMDMNNIDSFSSKADGIFMQASLLHIEKSNVPEVLAKITDRLNDQGVLYIGVKAIREDGIEEEIKTETRYGTEYKRFFSYFSMEELKEYYRDLRIETVWEHADLSGDTKWLQIIGIKK